MADRVFNNNKTMDYAKKDSINKLKEKIDNYSKSMDNDKNTIEEMKKSIENLNKEISEIGEKSREKVTEFRNKITSYVSQLQSYKIKEDFKDKFNELDNLNTEEFINNNTDFLSSFVDNQMLPSDKHYDNLLDYKDNFGSRHTQIIHCSIIDGWDNDDLLKKKYGFKEFNEFVNGLNKKCIKIPITIDLKTIEFGLVYRQKYNCSTEANEMILERYFTGKMFFNNCDAQDGDNKKKFEVRGIIFNADNVDENDVNDIGPIVKFKVVKDKKFIYLFLDDITPYRFLPVLEKIEGSIEKKLKLIDIVQYHTRTGKLEAILGPDSNDYYDRNGDKIELTDTIGINFEVNLSVLDFTSYNDTEKMEVFDFVSIDETQIDKKDSREFIIQPAPIGLVQLIGFDYTQNESEDVVNKVAQVEKKYFKNFELSENPELKKPVHKRRPVQANLLNWKKPQKYYTKSTASWNDTKGEVVTEADLKIPPDNYLDGLPFGAPLIGTAYDLEDLDPVTGNGINFKNLRIVAETSKYYIGLIESDLMYSNDLHAVLQRYSPLESNGKNGPLLNIFGQSNTIFDSKYDNVSMGFPQVINGSNVYNYDSLDLNMGLIKKMTRMFTEEGYEKLVLTGKRKVLETPDLLEYKPYFDKNLNTISNLMYPGVYSSFERLDVIDDKNQESAFYTHTIAYDTKTNYLYYMKINENSSLSNGVIYRKQVGHNINKAFKIFLRKEFESDPRFDIRENQFNMWIDDMNNNNIFPNYQKELIFSFLPISDTDWKTISTNSVVEIKNAKRIGTDYYKLVSNGMARINYFLLKDKTQNIDKIDYIGNGYFYGGFESDGRNNIFTQGWDNQEEAYRMTLDDEYPYSSTHKHSLAMIGHGKIGKSLPYSALFNPVNISPLPNTNIIGDAPIVLGIESDKKGGYGTKAFYGYPFTIDVNQFSIKYGMIYSNFNSERGSGKWDNIGFDNKNVRIELKDYNGYFSGSGFAVQAYGTNYHLIPPRISQFGGVMDGVFLGFMNNMTRNLDTTIGRFFITAGTGTMQNNIDFIASGNYTEVNAKTNYGVPFSVPNAYDKYSHLYVSLIAGRRIHQDQNTTLPKQYSYLELTTRLKNRYWKPLYWIYINKSNYQYHIRENIQYLHNTGLQSDGEDMTKLLFWSLFRSNNVLHSSSNDRFVNESLSINPTDINFSSDSFTLLMTNKFSFEMINGKDGKLGVQILDLEGNNKQNELQNILSSLLDNDSSIITEFVTKIAQNPENTAALMLKNYSDWKSVFNNSTFDYKELKKTKLKVIDYGDIDKLFIVSPCFVGFYARRTEGVETHDGFVFPVVLPDKVYSDDGRNIKLNSESMYMIQYFTIIPNIFDTNQDLWFIETINLGGLKRSENNISRTRISYRLAPTMFKQSKITDEDQANFPFKTTPSLLFDKWDVSETRDNGWNVIELNREINTKTNPNFPNAAFILGSYFDEKNKKLVCFLDSSKGLGDMATDVIFENKTGDEKSFLNEDSLKTKMGLNISKEYSTIVFDLTDLNNLTFKVGKSKDWIPWPMIDNDNIGYERFNMKYLIGEDSEGKYLIHPNKGIIYDISDYLNIRKRKNQRFPTTQVLYNDVRKSYIYLTNTSDNEYNDERKVFKGPALVEVPCYDIDFKEKTLSEEIREYLKERYDNNNGEDLMVEITVKMRAENLGLKNGSLERIPKFKFTEIGTYNPYSKTNKLVRYIDKITMFEDYYPRNEWIDDRKRWEYENIVDRKRLADRYMLDKRKDIELFFGGNVRADLRLSKMISQPLEGFENINSLTSPAIVEVVVYPTKVDFKNITYAISKKQGEDYDSKPDAKKNNMVKGFIDGKEILHNRISDNISDNTIDINNPDIWKLDEDISEFSFIDSYETMNSNISQLAILSNKYIVYNGGAKLEIYDRVKSKNSVLNIDLPITELGPLVVSPKTFKDSEDVVVSAICSNESIEKGFLVYWNDRYYKLFIDNYLFDKNQELTYKFDKNNNLWITSKEDNKWFVTVYELVYSDNNITTNKLAKYELSDVPNTEGITEDVYLTIDDITGLVFVVFTKLNKMYQIGFSSSSQGEQRIVGKDFLNTEGFEYQVFSQRNVDGFNLLRLDKLDISSSSTIGTYNPLRKRIFNGDTTTNINFVYNDKVKSFKPTDAITLRDNSVIIIGKAYDENDELIEGNLIYLYDSTKGNNTYVYELELPGEKISIDKISYNLRNDRLIISTEKETENKRVYILQVNYTVK